MSHKWTVSIATLATMFGSCRSEPADRHAWVDPRIEKDVVFDSTNLKFLSVEDISKQFNHGLMVMVTFPSGSSLGRELAESPETVAYNPSGSALVAVPNRLTLEGLAMAAHAAGNHSCGNLAAMPLAPAVSPVPVPPVYADAIKLTNAATLVDGLDDQALNTSIAGSIAQLEAMGTRFHSSPSGLKTPGQVAQMLQDAAGGKVAGFKATQVGHKATPQSSVVVTIPGQDDPSASGPVVIIGAHLDSINATDRSGPAPGADDDASGIATLIEIVKILASSGAQFKRTVELHAYAGEELGLLGSRELAANYAGQGRQVAAMLQLDMNSWSSDPASKTIYLVQNNTSSVLRRSLKNLMTSYLGGDYIEKSLTHGTSDHQSWNDAGFPAVFPFEDPTNYNEALHTPKDTSKTLNNVPLTTRFVKLAVLFLAHHAGLVSANDSYADEVVAMHQGVSKDLRLAIAPTETDGTYTLSVAGDAAVKTIEMCEVDQPGGMGCVKELVVPDSVKATSAHAFFGVKGTLPIRDGVHVALFGYDANDKLVAQRSVRLVKK